MSRGKDLVKNTGILFVAKTSTQVVSFFLLPLYTALLSTKEYGQLDIYYSLVMILMPVITLQLEQAIFRFLISVNEEEIISSVITSALYTLLISFSLVSTIYIVLALLFRFEYCVPLYFYYAGIMCSTVLYQVCRGFGKNMVYGFATFLISLITVSLNIVFVAVFKFGILGVIISTAIAHIIGSVYMILRTKAYKYVNRKYISKVRTIEMLKYSVPLIFNQISSWAINYSDRLIILGVLGKSMNGIYSVANKFSNILNTFFNVFNLAWTENVVKNIHDKDALSYTNRIITITIQMYFSLIIGIINLLPFVFDILVNESYSEAYNHVPILLTAAVFSGLSASLGSVYVAFKKTKNVGITTVISGIVNIGVHFALIYFIGLYAASISTLVSFIALFVYRYLNIQKFYKIKISYSKCILVFAILIFSWIAYVVKNPILIIAGLVLNLANIAWMFLQSKAEIMSILKRRSKNAENKK